MGVKYFWIGKLKGYEDFYDIYSDGRIYSLRKNIFLSSGDSGNGYKFIYLYKNGKRKKWYVHRLIATVFIENKNNFPQVNHKNETKNDNRVENLEWVTSKYNINYGTARKRQSETQSVNEKHFETTCVRRCNFKTWCRKHNENFNNYNEVLSTEYYTEKRGYKHKKFFYFRKER